FLRNHDELTLEMVSDEERDYMYRAYAHDPRMRVNVGIRRRLAPLLNNDRRMIELMNGLLFSLPGTPVLYYGDEIGMGDNIYLGDRNGVRTPMQWSPDRNAGFSRANPQRLYLPVVIDPEYHYEAVNVEAQQANPNSHLWFTKRLIALRRQSRVFGRGETTVLYPENPRILSFVRSFEGDQVLIVANLSHLAQVVDLDLHAFRGTRPVELFGHTPFPPVTESPYRLSLGPYGIFWFRLETPTATEPGGALPPPEPLELRARGDWNALADPEVRARLERYLPAYLQTQRWFRGKDLAIDSVRWQATLPLDGDPTGNRLAIVELRFADAEPQTYLLPLGFATAGPPETLGQAPPSHVVANFQGGASTPLRLLYDVAQEPEFVRRLVARIARNRRQSVGADELVLARTSAFRSEAEGSVEALPVLPLGGEQSNTSTRVGERYTLKLFREIEPGPNPEIELGEFLLRHGPAPVAPLAGYAELRSASGEVYTLASLHHYIPNEGDAWGVTRDQLRSYLERARAHFSGGREPPESAGAITLQPIDPPTIAVELVGSYLDMAQRLGERTAEFHRALASERFDPAFAPEPFNQMYARSIFQTMQTQRQQVLGRLREVRPRLAEVPGRLADRVLAREAAVEARYRQLLDRRFSGQRIRIHGDYHLGQVLWTGKDFVIIDLEGEPLRPITERRIKRSPLRDIAGMLRSFDYAARSALEEVPLATSETPGQSAELQVLADLWVAWVSGAFLRGYHHRAATEPFVPADPEEFETLLRAYMLEKAIYEVGYEIADRPQWLPIPLRGLDRLLASESG
ncbi:MAG: putative maltokinase, partial [Thermoplasmata archaeon]